MYKIIFASFAIFLGCTSASFAQHSHEGHAAMTAQENLPTEGGQSAFAAIAEIVKILQDDPKTDWSKVNISALRDHLVDMSDVTLNAEASQIRKDGVVTFTISGEGRTLTAVQSMVPAHAQELAKIEGWEVTAKTTATGAILEISSGIEGELTKISALGFFGVMTMGAHHQPHHMAMATGDMMGH